MRSGFVLVFVAIVTFYDQRQTQPPGILIESLAGRDSFDLYCSPCHGRTGQGDGPVASSLAIKPADLSQLSLRNGGSFPADRVRAIVMFGIRPIPAHGTSEMPIWGPLFAAFESDVRVRERIANILRHIETLQRPATGSLDRGAQVFKTYCASCHGAGGRGDGPMVEHLRKLPPDLTTYSLRNGGVFPSERIRQIIDGTGVGAHGRDMPVWGDAFRTSRGGLTPEAVAKRIDDLVRYLATLQARTGH